MTTRTTRDESKDTGARPRVPVEVETATRRASDQPTGGDKWGGVLRKSSQPEWYSEYRTSTLSQTASRLEQLRGHVTSHYDFHIAEIKGEKCHWVSGAVNELMTRVNESSSVTGDAGVFWAFC